MKKVYLLGASLFLGVCAFAQLNATDYKFTARKFNLSKTKERPETKKNNINKEKAAGDVIWSEDFETGSFTTNNGDWISVGTNDYWNVSDIHPWWSNGLSDLNGQFLYWSSTTVASPVAEAVSGSIMSPVIDMTGITSAMLNFNTEAQYCCNNAEYPFRITMSNDNGTTWSDTVELDFGIERNQPTESSSNPLAFTLKLDDFGLNYTNTVRLKFIWESVNPDNNGQYSTHYYWNIDDIQIVESYNYDISLNSLWLADIINDYEYTDIPRSFAGNLTVMATTSNWGAQIPSNISLNVEVYDTAGTFITSASGGTFSNNFIMYETDTVVFETGIDLSSFDFNMYYIDAYFSMDQTDENNSNDTVSRTFRISESYYGQRNYDAQYRFYNNIGDANAPDYQAYELGNVMYIPSDIDLHGIELPIVNTTTYPTTANTEIAIKFHEFDPYYFQNGLDFNGGHVALDPVRYFTLVDTLIPQTGAATVLLNFHKAEGENGPVTLTGGKYYIVSVAHDGGTDNSFSTLVNDSDDDYSTHLYGDYGSTPGDRWFTYGEQFLTRLVFDESLSLNENNTFANVSEVYPNPTTGEATIAYNLGNASNVTVKVVDITGKVVYTVPAENKAAGKHNLNINAASFKSGVYYVTIVTEESQVTKKLIRK